MILNWIRCCGSSSVNLGEYGVPLAWDSLKPGLQVPVRVPSMGQMDPFKNHSYSIGPWAKKKKDKNPSK